jgi:hypothetical protein
LGALAGALVLTKVTAALVAPGLLLAVLLAARTSRERARLGLLFAGAAALVCGWWFAQNQIRYGDPLASSATTAHFRAVFPPLLDVGNPANRIFDQIPKGIFKSFWYDSGWNQFQWRWFWYLPFWGLAVLGIAGLCRQRSGARLSPPLIVCSVIALGGLAIVWVLGLQTNTEQARVAFVALPAIAVLIAVGYQRLRLPVGWRFLLPAIGLVGTVAAIRYDVIIPYLS